MSLETLDLSQFIVLGAVFAGITELVTRIRAKDYWVVATILTCVAVGAIFGATNYYPNLDAAEGIAYGFGASGAIAAIGVSRSNAKASSVTRK